MSIGAAEKLVQALSRAGVPTTVTFQVTDRCNYECVHCYQHHGDDDELAFADIERILGELADFGVLFLTLVGGEFFMRRDADDILRAARRHGFAIKLKTTGHHVDDRRADLIASLQPIQVDLSMYAADPAIHDGVTAQAGSWERTAAAARRLRARGVMVQLNSPVLASNVEALPEVAALARELGAEWAFDPFVTGTETGDVAPTRLRASDGELRAFLQREDIGVWDAVQGLADAPDKPADTTPCRAGSAVVAITPQGKVRPCQSLAVECGDLTQHSFAEVWHGSRQLDEIRGLAWAGIDECARCELRKYCRRCHAMALLEDGKLAGPSLEACRQAVLARDVLRDRGLVPATETAMPPTWERVQAATRGVRSAALRVLS